jgi:uncharacterized protein DUF6088
MSRDLASPRRRGVTQTIRRRIENSTEKQFWRHTDFADLPAAAVAQALHRLAAERILQRVHKGLYYHARPTTFGASVPASADIAAMRTRGPLQPAGLTAANALGLTTQNPARAEYVTSWQNPPAALQQAVIHARRPLSRSRITWLEGAVLEFLRERGRTSDFEPDETVRRLTKLLREGDTFAHLASAAKDEPPRVRAMLGALGEEVRANPVALARLRQSLNPLSRFDFGVLRALPHAKEWQAR